MSIKKRKKVIIAMSGGVDSSVSAWILKKQGYHVEGVFMKNWEEDDSTHYCSSKKDLKDVQNVCDQLKISLHKINFSFEYWETVFSVFLLEHSIGRTPNPDILCNKEIKFKVFFEFCIKDLKADYIATGHYVRKKFLKDKYILLRGLDINKDQSYFLYTINQNVLKKCIFPVGTLLKTQVRKIANQLSLSVANKKDSTGICFINPKNIKNFLNNYLPQKIGNIITTKGKIIGKHIGLVHYTLGQRKGLAIGGLKNFSNTPWYVIKKNVYDNSLVVAQGVNNKFLMSIGLIANQLHWINYVNIKKSFFCSVKTRYRQVDVFCQVFLHKCDSVKVIFKNPISSVTPGQSVVFYNSELCLGGGIIEQKLPLVNC